MSNTLYVAHEAEASPLLYTCTRFISFSCCRRPSVSISTRCSSSTRFSTLSSCALNRSYIADMRWLIFACVRARTWYIGLRHGIVCGRTRFARVSSRAGGRKVVSDMRRLESCGTRLGIGLRCRLSAGGCIRLDSSLLPTLCPCR